MDVSSISRCRRRWPGVGIRTGALHGGDAAKGSVAPRLKNTEIVPKACGEQRGELQFDVPLQGNGAISGGQAHVAARNDARPGWERHARCSASKQITCEVVRIDDVVPESDSVSLMKLDIEGAELAALRGASGVIERCRPVIVCEINPWFLEGLGLTVHDVLSFFDGYGYAMHRVRDGSLTRVPKSEVAEGNYVYLHATV